MTDFHGAMSAANSKAMYESFLDELRRGYKGEKIQGEWI